jgi:hypothetical protein
MPLLPAGKQGFPQLAMPMRSGSEQLLKTFPVSPKISPGPNSGE